MNDEIEMLRRFVRTILLEEKRTLGEPDYSAEKERDEPQPQYDDESSSGEETDEDVDEFSGVAALGGGPMVPLGYDADGTPAGKKKDKK